MLRVKSLRLLKVYHFSRAAGKLNCLFGFTVGKFNDNRPTFPGKKGNQEVLVTTPTYSYFFYGNARGVSFTGLYNPYATRKTSEK